MASSIARHGPVTGAARREAVHPARGNTHPEAAADGGVRARSRRRRALIWVMLGVPSLFMLFFLGVPVGRAIYTSLTNYALTGPNAAHPSYVGGHNYLSLLTSGAFWDGLRASVEYLVGSAIVGQVVVGFLLAVFIERLGKLARSVLLSVVVLAWIIPEIVVAFIWSGYLSVPNGLANTLLAYVGVGPVSFLFKYAMPSLVVANAWRGMAFSVLVLGAALQAVPGEVVESAKLDGAGEWGVIRYVKLPLIRSAVATVLALTTLWTLSDFTLVFVLTGGGPGHATDILPVYTYQQSFSFYELGLGTAISLVLLVLACGLAFFYMRVAAADLRQGGRGGRTTPGAPGQGGSGRRRARPATHGPAGNGVRASEPVAPVASGGAR
jgi:multiple sugar transport system permease protein